MILSVSISKEISTQYRVTRWFHSLAHPISLIYSIEVVRQCAKLGLNTENYTVNKLDGFVNNLQIQCSSSKSREGGGERGKMEG